MARSPHSKKEVEEALKHAELAGWRVEQGLTMEFTFTLTYRLPESDSNQRDIVERLGAAGCTDALVGIGHSMGLTGVAEVVGVTRQNLRKLMLGYGDNFPLPVHEGTATVWHLADMLEWLKSKVAYQVEPTTLAVAQATKQINLVKLAGQIAPNINREIDVLVV